MMRRRRFNSSRRRGYKTRTRHKSKRRRSTRLRHYGSSRGGIRL